MTPPLLNKPRAPVVIKDMEKKIKNKGKKKKQYG